MIAVMTRKVGLGSSAGDESLEANLLCVRRYFSDLREIPRVHLKAAAIYPTSNIQKEQTSMMMYFKSA